MKRLIKRLCFRLTLGTLRLVDPLAAAAIDDSLDEMPDGDDSAKALCLPPVDRCARQRNRAQALAEAGLTEDQLEAVVLDSVLESTDPAVITRGLARHVKATLPVLTGPAAQHRQTAYRMLEDAADLLDDANARSEAVA